MLKENWRLISRIERAGDALIIIGAFFLSYYGRDSLLYWNRSLNLNLPFEGAVLAPIGSYYIVLIIALVSYTVFLNLLGGYASMRLSSHWRLLRISAVASLLVFFTIAAFLFLIKVDLSRSFIALFCSLVGLSLTAQRYLVLRVLRYWRQRGKNFRNIIVSGISDQAVRLAGEIARHPELGIFIRSFADLANSSANDTDEFKQQLIEEGYPYTVRVIHGKEGVVRAVREYAIDEVIFTDIVDVMGAVEEIVLVCAEQGVRTTIAADLFSIGLVKSGLSYFAGIPLIHFQTPPGDRWELSVKRVVDVIVSAFLLVLLSPFFILIALAIKLCDGGPVIFTQKRMGLSGKIFDLYKFRSMCVDSEQRLLELKGKNEMAGPVFKMRDDPRVTGVGKILRRFSLDELPQLWNVLIGDMSIVGPRPPVPGEVSLYERRDRRRLSMRPGLTCTWQVSGRSNIRDFESWVKLDLEYIDNWSLSRDFILMLKTIPAVIFGEGAR